MTMMPLSQASHIADDRGGGGSNASGGAAVGLKGNPAGVKVKVHDTFGNSVATKIWVEIWGCWGVTLKPNQRLATLFIPQDKWDAQAYVPPGGPAGQCVVKAHAVASDPSKASYGLPGNPVAPGSEFVQNVPIALGQLAEIEIVLDPVTSGTLKQIKATLPPSQGIAGSARFPSGTTWSMDAATPATVGSTRQSNAPSVIRGSKAIQLEAVTDPEGLPVKWQVVPWSGSPASTPTITPAFGRYASIDCQVAGCWAIQASTDSGATWTAFALEVIDVALAGAATAGGQGSFTYEHSKDYSTQGFGSGVFFDDANGGPGPNNKGFWCKVPVTITTAFDSSLKLVALAAIQNVVSQSDLTVKASYDDGSTTQTKKLAKTPALDADSKNQSCEWWQGSGMVLATPSQQDVNTNGGTSPLTVQFEYCDSPGPYFSRKLKGAKLKTESGGAAFKVALVAQTDSAPNTWVAIAEARWSVDLSGTFEINLISADNGTPSGSRNPGSGFAAIGPKDIGTGGAGYEINGPSILGGGWAWDPMPDDD